MSEIEVSFRPSWIHHKTCFSIDDHFAEILKFYVWGTPCENISSSGRSMKKYNWSKNVWKKGALRNYLMSSAGLRNGITYKKAQIV